MTAMLSESTLAAIEYESERAHLLHHEHSMLGSALDSGMRLAVLVEEVGEVARCLCEEYLAVERGGRSLGTALIEGELAQVAAMAAGWLQVLREQR